MQMWEGGRVLTERTWGADENAQRQDDQKTLGGARHQHADEGGPGRPSLRPDLGPPASRTGAGEMSGTGGTRSKLLRRPRGHTKDDPGVHSPAARPEPPSLTATGPCLPSPPHLSPAPTRAWRDSKSSLPASLWRRLSALTGPPAACPPGTAHLAPGTGSGWGGRSPGTGRVHLPPVSAARFTRPSLFRRQQSGRTLSCGCTEAPDGSLGRRLLAHTYSLLSPAGDRPAVGTQWGAKSAEEDEHQGPGTWPEGNREGALLPADAKGRLGPAPRARGGRGSKGHQGAGDSFRARNRGSPVATPTDKACIRPEACVPPPTWALPGPAARGQSQEPSHPESGHVEPGVRWAFPSPHQLRHAPTAR